MTTEHYPGQPIPVPTAHEYEALFAVATAEEREQLVKAVKAHMKNVQWCPLPGPQTTAYESTADVVGYAGSGGSGKTDLGIGLALRKHRRTVMFRRERAQLSGTVQRMGEVLGNADGYNSTQGRWDLPNGHLLEFGGLNNPGDELRWQGRPHGLIIYDEAAELRESQVRFTMGWNRDATPGAHKPQVYLYSNPPQTEEGRWFIDWFAPWLDTAHPLYPRESGSLLWVASLPDERGEFRDTWLERSEPFTLATDGTLNYEFPADTPVEDIITPKSRTFISARVTDNPYMVQSGYIQTLQALPEPLRSQLLYGSFTAGVQDDAFQVVPTAWVKAAQARWREPTKAGEMLAIGVDVARGGKDDTVLAPRHRHDGTDLWFARHVTVPGKDTPDGPTVAGLVVAHRRDNAPVSIDAIGVGASPLDFLRTMRVQVDGVVVSKADQGRDKSGALGFTNTRSALWWRLREALDPSNNTGICLPPDPRLLKELCAPTWRAEGGRIRVEGRDELITRLGWSPDVASAYALALRPVTKTQTQPLTRSTSPLDYDPYA